MAIRQELDANRAALKTIVEIFSTGDFSQVTAVIDPEYVDHQGLRGREIRGEVIRETIEILRFENGRAAEHWGQVSRACETIGGDPTAT